MPKETFFIAQMLLFDCSGVLMVILLEFLRTNSIRQKGDMRYRRDNQLSVVLANLSTMCDFKSPLKLKRRRVKLLGSFSREKYLSSRKRKQKSYLPFHRISFSFNDQTRSQQKLQNCTNMHRSEEHTSELQSHSDIS